MPTFVCVKKLFLGIFVLAGAMILGFVFLPDDVEAPVAEQIVTVQRLTSDEYKAVAQEFLDLVEAEDPRVALDALETRLVTDKQLLLSCHSLVHEIGHAAYDKYDDFDRALSYTNETCNNGYLHGVIEEHFSQVPDVLENLDSLCSGYDLGRCLHGVGHGLMFFTNNDLPRSIALCHEYEQTHEQNFCAQGVFMENFNTDQKLHPSVYLKSEDPFYPCAEQDRQHKPNCYFYAPTYFLSLHDLDYQSAFAWCETAEAGMEATCVRGVGSLAMKYNLHDVKTVEAICESAPANRVPLCIDGMVGLYLNHYDSLETAGLLCEVLNRENKDTCAYSIQVRQDLFHD